MIRKADGGSTSGGRDSANVKVNTSRRRRKEQGPDSRSVIKALLHTASYENSDKIALAIYRDITDTLKCNRENEEYVERIRRELFLLCNYNRALTKAEGRFPRMHSLKNVLARYIDLEYIVLYSKTNEGVKRSEREVEKRMRSILYMMLSNVQQQPVDHKFLHKSVLFVLQQVDKRYWAEERIVHKLNVHVFQKYGKFDAIVKIKDSREDFLIEHLRNNDPDIAYLSVDPFEDVRDFEPNIFIKIPEVNSNKIYSFGSNIFTKTKCKKFKKVKSDEDVKQCGVILMIDLTSEAQADENKTNNTLCSTKKQQSIRDKCRKLDLSNKDLLNSSVQTVEKNAVKSSTNDLSASCQSNDIIVISDSDVPENDEGSVSVPNAKADVIDLTSDDEQEVQERDDCVAQNKSSEDPAPIPAPICPSSPLRLPPQSAPVNQVNEISDNNEPSPITQHTRMRSVTINQVNEVSSSVISESDEVSRNEEVPPNDGNVSSTGNSPNRNSVPYFNGEISSTTGKLDENALIELIFRKQSDFIDCSFENSPSQSSTVYNKKFDAEKECGISSPTDEGTSNLDSIELARVQNDEVPKQHEEEPIISIDTEESTNDPCSSKQSQSHLQIASAQSDVLKNEDERVAASCHRDEAVEREEPISQSVTEKESESDGDHRNVYSTEPAEHGLLLISVETLMEQIEETQQSTESNLHSLKPVEHDASNSPPPLAIAKTKTSAEEVEEQRHSYHNETGSDVLSKNAELLNIDNSLISEDTNSHSKSDNQTEAEVCPEKTDEAQIINSDTDVAMINHSECNSDANEDISIILEALINASIDDKVIEAEDIESHSLNKASGTVFEEIDERVFFDIIVNEYNELVSLTDEYEKQIVYHGVESTQNNDELKPPKNPMQFKEVDDSLAENNELQVGASLMQGIELNDAVGDDHTQLKSKPDDILLPSFTEICVSHGPISKEQVEEDVEPTSLAENIVDIEEKPFDEQTLTLAKQIDKENSLTENINVEDKQSEGQALISAENERIPDKPSFQKNSTEDENEDATKNQLHVTNNDNEVELRNSLHEPISKEQVEEDVEPTSLPENIVDIEEKPFDEQTLTLAKQIDEENFLTENVNVEDKQSEGQALISAENERIPDKPFFQKNSTEDENGNTTKNQLHVTNNDNEVELRNSLSKDLKPDEHPQVLQEDWLACGGEEKIVSESIAEVTCNTDEFNLEDLPGENERFKSGQPEKQVDTNLKKKIDSEDLESLRNTSSSRSELELNDFKLSDDQSNSNSNFNFDEPSFTGDTEQCEDSHPGKDERPCESDTHANNEPFRGFMNLNSFEPSHLHTELKDSCESPTDNFLCEGDSSARSFSESNQLQDDSNDVEQNTSGDNQHCNITETTSDTVVLSINKKNIENCDVIEKNENALTTECETHIINVEKIPESICVSLTEEENGTNQDESSILDDAQENRESVLIKPAETNESTLAINELPITTVQASLDSSISSNSNCAAEITEIDYVREEPPINSVQRSLDPSVFAASGNLEITQTNEDAVSNDSSPIKSVQTNLNSPVLNNASFAAETSEKVDIKTTHDPSVLTNGNVTTETDVSNTPIRNVQTNLDPSVLANGNLTLETTVQTNLDPSVLTNENLITETNISNTPIKTVQTNLDPSVLTNRNLTTETNVNNTPIKTVQTNLDSSVLTNKNSITETNVNNTPIRNVLTNLDPSVLTDGNLTTETGISNIPVKTVQTNLDPSVFPVDKNIEITQTNEDAVSNDNSPIKSVQANLNPSVLTNASFPAKVSEKADVKTSLDPSVVTNENLTAETNVSNTPIKTVLTNLDPPVLTSGNLTAETNAKTVQTNLDISILTNENLATETNVSNTLIETVQGNLDPPVLINLDSSVLTNGNLTTETNVSNTLIETVQANLKPPVLTNENLTTETNVSNTPIKTLLTNLDPLVLTNGNLTTETHVKTVQTNLDPSILANENLTTETNVSNTLIETVQANLDPPVLTNENLTTETNVSNTPIKTVLTNLDPSVLTNENLTTETNVNNTPIRNEPTNLGPSVLTNGNVTKESNVSNTSIKTVQTNLDPFVLANENLIEINDNVNESPIKTVLTNKNFEAETNEKADVTEEPPIKNLTPSASTNHNFTGRVQPASFVIDEKQAANVLECYKNSRNFYVMDQHNFEPEDFVYTPKEELVNEAPKEKSVPSELSVLIYNPDVNKNPLNLLATAAGTRPNLEVSPSKKLERSRVKMGRGNKPCTKGGKRQRSPKAASNMKTRTTPPRAAKNNVALNYCDRNKRFSIRNWVERNMRFNKTDEIVQQTSQSTYNSDFNVTNDESSDSFDGLVIAEDVELPETENPIDILDENTVDNELVLIRSESAVQISIPETEEYDHQILDDLEKIEVQKEQTVCKNLFGYDSSNLLNINKISDGDDASKKIKTTDHSIQSILNISSPRSKSNLDFTLYNTENDSALDLSVGKCVPYEKSRANLVPYILTDDGEILSPKCMSEGVIECNAKSGGRIQTKTKAEVKEYPFVCLSRHEVANYISSQAPPPAEIPLTTQKKNLRSQTKFKNFKSRKRMSKENKRSRRGRGVKKTKLPLHQILDKKTKEIKKPVVADRKYEKKSKSTKQKNSKPSKKERADSFNSQAETEEFQKTTTTTDTNKKGKIVLITDLFVGKDATKRGEKTERNKNSKNNSKEESGEANFTSENEQEKVLAASVNEIEMTKSKKNIKRHNSIDSQELGEESELKLKKNEVVRNTVRRRTMESKANEQDEVEIKNTKNEIVKNTRSTERQRAVEEIKRKEQENQLETMPKKRGSEPENNEAFSEDGAAIQPKKSETTKSIRKSAESKRNGAEVKSNRNEIIRKEKCEGTEENESERNEAVKIESRNIEKTAEDKRDDQEHQPQISKTEKRKKIEGSETEGDKSTLEKKSEKLETKCKIKNAKNFDKHKMEDSKQEEKEAIKSEKHSKAEAESEREKTTSSKQAEKLKTKSKKNELPKSIKSSKTEKEVLTMVNELEKKIIENKESEPEKSEVPSKKANEMLEVKPKKNKIVKNSKRNEQELTSSNKAEKKSEIEKHTTVKEVEVEEEKDEVTSKKESDKPKRNSKRNEHKLTSSIESKKKIIESRKTLESNEIEQGKEESTSVEKLEIKSKKMDIYLKSNKRNEQVKDILTSIDEPEKKNEIVKSTGKFKMVKSKENEQDKDEVTSVKETENLKTKSKKNEVIKNCERDEKNDDVHSVIEPEDKDKIKNCTESQKMVESNELEKEIIKESEILVVKLKENEIVEATKDIEKQKPVDTKGNELKEILNTENCESLGNRDNERNKIKTISVCEMQKPNEIESSQKLVSEEEEIKQIKNNQNIAGADDVKNTTQIKNCKEENKVEIEEKLSKKLLVEDSEIEGGTGNANSQDENIKPKGDEKAKSRKGTCDLIEQNELCKIKDVESENLTKAPDFEIVENRESILTSTEDKHPSENTENKERNVLVKQNEITNNKDEANVNTKGSKNKESDFIVITRKDEPSNMDVEGHVGLAVNANKEIGKDLGKFKEDLVPENLINTKNSVHLTQIPLESEKESPRASSNQIIDTEIPLGSKRKLPTEPVSEAPKKLKLSIERLKQSLGDKLRVAETERKDPKPKQTKHKFYKIEDIISNLKSKETHKNELPQKVTRRELVQNKKSDGAVTSDVNHGESSETLQKDLLDGGAIIPKTQTKRKSLLGDVAITVKEESKSEIVEPLGYTLAPDLKQKKGDDLPMDDLANDTVTKQENNDITRRPPHHPSLDAAESSNELSLDGAVNLDSVTTETPVIDAVTKQVEVNVLSFKQKSPRHSPSHTVAGDVKSLNDVPLDGAVSLDSTTTKTSVIDAVTKQVEVNVLSVNQKSPRHSPSHTVAEDVKCLNEVPLDDAVNLDSTTTEASVIDAVTKHVEINVLSFNQKSPRHSPSQAVARDVKSLNEVPLEGAVNLDSTTTETSAIDAMTKQTDINVLKFKQKSPCQSPSHTVTDDVRSFNEVPLDGEVNLESTTTKTSAIDAMTQQADINVLSFKQKSPHHSPLHTVTSDEESFNEAPLDGAMDLDSDTAETSAIDAVRKQTTGVNSLCFNPKSPRYSPSHTVAGDAYAFSEVPLDGAVNLDCNTTEAPVIDSVTKQADVNIKYFNQKSPCNSPLHTVEGDRTCSNEAPVDGVVNFDDNIMETSVLDAEMKQDDHIANCLKQELPSQSPLDISAGAIKPFSEMPLGGAPNLDRDAMETSAIDAGVKQDDNNAVCLNEKPPDHSPLYPSTDDVEPSLDGAVNLDANIIEATKQDDHNIMYFSHSSLCHSPLPAAAAVDVESLDELPLDAADTNIMETSAKMDENICVESINSNDNVAVINRKLSIDELPLDGVTRQRHDSAVVLQYDVVHADSETLSDGAVSTEQSDECLKEDLAHELPMDGDSVVKQSGLPQLHKPSLDSATSVEQKHADDLYHMNEDGASVHGVFSTEQKYCPNENSHDIQKGREDSHEPPLDGAFSEEEKGMDVIFYRPNEISSHEPVKDGTSFTEQNSKSLYEPLLDGASVLPSEPEISVTHNELSSTEDISETAGSTTEQKMEEILSHEGVFPAEDLSKTAGNTTEERVKFSFVKADVSEQQTDTSLEDNSQPENADDVENLPIKVEPTEDKKIAIGSSEALDVECCYKTLRDVLLDNNQKNLRSNLLLERCPKQHDEITESPKVTVAQDMMDEVKLKNSSQTAISCSMLDCGAKQKNSSFSLYTQEEINDNSIVNPPSVYIEAKKLDGKIIPATSTSATQKITSIYTQEEINDCTTHPKKGDSLNPLGNKKMLLPLPNMNSLIDSAKEMFVKASAKQPPDFAYSSDFIDLPSHNATGNIMKEIKPDFLYSGKSPSDKNLEFFEENKSTENIDNICVESLNFLPHNILHTDPIPMWRLGEVISENVDILTANSSNQQLKSGVEFDDSIQEERSANEGVWSEQDKQNCSEKVQGSHLQAFENTIQEEGVGGNGIDVDEIPSRKTLNSSGTIHIILEPSEHNYCIGGPLLNAKPKNNVLKQVDTESLSKMKNNEQISDGSPVDGEHIFHFSEQISSLVKNNMSTLSMEDSPVDENNDDQDDQKIFSLIENSNTFSFSQPTVMSVEKMNDVMMAIANLNSLTSVQNKKLDKQKADFLFQQEDSISSDDSTVSNDVHSDCDFAINSIAMLRTQHTTSDSVDDSDFPPHATDLFTSSLPSMNVIVKHNQSDFASIDSIFSGNDFDIIAQSKTTVENGTQSQHDATDVPVKQQPVVDTITSKKRKPEGDAEHKADVHISQVNSKPSDGKLSSIQSNILDDMLVKAMQRQNSRTRVLAAQKKVHKEKNEVTSSSAIDATNQCQEKVHKEKNEVTASRATEAAKQSQEKIHKEKNEVTSLRVTEAAKQSQEKIHKEKNGVTSLRATEAAKQSQEKIHKEKNEVTSSRTAEAAKQSQEKIHKEKNEVTSSRAIEITKQSQEKIHKEKNEVTSSRAIETTKQSQEKVHKEKNEIATSRTIEVTKQSQEKIHKEKSEVTSQINRAIETMRQSPTITIVNKTQTPSINCPPLLLPKQDRPPNENSDDQPPVLTPEIQFIKFKPYEDSPGKTQHEDIKIKISRKDEVTLQKPREDMIDGIKRRQRRPPEKYVDSVLLKVEKETQEEKFKVFEKNKIKSALSSLVKLKEKKPKKRPAEDESSNDSSKSMKLRAKLIECSDYDENTSSEDFYKNKRRKKLKASEMSDSSASDTDLEIKIRKERRMTSEERDALFFKVRDGKDCEEQKRNNVQAKNQQDTGVQKQVRFNLQQHVRPSTETKQKKVNAQTKPQQDTGVQKQVRFNLKQHVCPSTETKSEKYKQCKSANESDAPVKGYYMSSYGGHQHSRQDYRDRYMRVPNGGSQSSRYPSYPSQSSEQIYRSRSRSPLMKFGNSSERKSGFQDYRVYANSQNARNSRSHPETRNVDLPTLLSHYSQIHRASNSSTEWSKNVSGIGTPLPNVSFQAPPNTSKDSSKRT